MQSVRFGVFALVCALLSEIGCGSGSSSRSTQPPSFPPATERGVEIQAVGVVPDGARLAGLLARTATGELPARVAEVLPLDRFDDAHAAVAKGGVRGRYVLTP